MRLPRMTTRRTMVVILLLAIVLSWMANRTGYRRQRAEGHLRQLRSLIYPVDPRTDQPYGSMDPVKARANAHRVEFHQGMAKKWETGARYFWLSVEPDPPAPGP